MKSTEEKFLQAGDAEISAMSRDAPLGDLTRSWISLANSYRYSYHFQGLGRPIIQYPQDMIALQEIIWDVRPSVIIETGIAHGGSLVWSAAMLALLDYTDASSAVDFKSLSLSKRRVIGIDIEIRDHNRAAISRHPLAHKITMLEGSSADKSIFENVKAQLSVEDRVLVLLDSNHGHQHVFDELLLYGGLVSKGSYCIVYDTIIEHLPHGSFPNRPWDVGNNPKTAVKAYLEHLDVRPVAAADGLRLRYQPDERIENKLLVTVAPGGYLKRL